MPMYGLTTDKSINETLQAIDRATEEALKSKENAIKFLQRIGLLDENGEPTEWYLDSLKDD
jgi:hypothetical protein